MVNVPGRPSIMSDPESAALRKAAWDAKLRLEEEAYRQRAMERYEKSLEQEAIPPPSEQFSSPAEIQLYYNEIKKAVKHYPYTAHGGERMATSGYMDSTGTDFCLSDCTTMGTTTVGVHTIAGSPLVATPLDLEGYKPPAPPKPSRPMDRLEREINDWLAGVLD